jgi:ribosomal protein S18 acetylase RimI-like enzyme
VSVRVEIVSEVTEGLVEDLNRLLPQLSASAAPLTTSLVKSLVGSPVTTLFVARVEESVVGTMTLANFDIPTGPRAWIEDVVVDEATRGTGVGEALTMAAIDEARRLGVHSLDLTSRPSREAANRLYTRMGFTSRETNVFRLGL